MMTWQLISAGRSTNCAAITARMWGLVIAVVLTACGGPPTAPAPVIAGSWRGSFESPADDRVDELGQFPIVQIGDCPERHAITGPVTNVESSNRS